MTPVQRHHPAPSFPTASSPHPPQHLYTTAAVSAHHASIGTSSQETELSPNSGLTPWSHVVWNNLEELSLDGDSQQRSGNATFASSWQEEAHWMSFRHAVQHFAALKLVNTTTVLLEEQQDEGRDGASSLRDATNSSGTTQNKKRPKSPTLEADLAETKMRLAVAQAERDELEYALLQRGSTSSAGGSPATGAGTSAI